MAERTWHVGPSADYLALLREEISSEEYVARLKAEVDARYTRDVRGTDRLWRRWKARHLIGRFVRGA